MIPFKRIFDNRSLEASSTDFELVPPRRSLRMQPADTLLPPPFERIPTNQAPWKPPHSLAPPAVDEGNHKDVPIFTGDNSIFANW